MNDIESLKQRIAKLESELKQAEQDKRDYEHLTPMQKFAVELHKRFCGNNHTDGCAWEYSAIGDWTPYDKESWFNEARELISLWAKLQVK